MSAVERKTSGNFDQYEVKEPIKNNSKAAQVAKGILKSSPSSDSAKRVSFQTDSPIFLKPQFSLITDTLNQVLLKLILSGDVTPEQLETHPFADDEIASVKKFDFSGADFSDAHLIILIQRFPGVQEVVLSKCATLTDEGVSLLSRLEGLHTVRIVSCPKVTEKGIAELPLERLRVFGLTSMMDISVKLVQRLAKSPALRCVDFSSCPKFNSEMFLCLKECAGLQQIKVKGCNIPHETILELNRGRNGPLLEVNEDGQDILDPEYLPNLPDSMEVFRMSSTNPIFKHRSALMLPSEAVVSTFNFPMKQRGMDLSGVIPLESLSALIKRFPEMEWVRIYESNLFGYSELITLAQLERAKVLYLGLLPDITSRGIEVMFSPRKGVQPWSELREIYFCQMPVTDTAMQLMAGLPKLEKVTLSDCSPYTVRGFFTLVKGCKSLKYLSLAYSLPIDPFAIAECRALRPDVEIFTDEIVDLSAIPWVMDEADRRMRDPSCKRMYVFITGIIDSPEPIPEGGKIDLDPEQVTQYYLDQLDVLGVELEINNNGNLQEQWMRCDQILQAYLNVTRSLWALRQEFLRVGFYTRQDQEPLPNTAEAILKVLDNPDYVRKVQRFDFSQLELTAIPYFILDLRWEQLREIFLDATLISQISNTFKGNCPKLKTIVYGKQKAEVLEPLLSPRTNHLPPPKDMGDPDLGKPSF
ncbi:MAG: hypothetical protein K1X28_08110 [Parachlamydiales bacterium]|nr:hypothetical protein [Parachlamydiales bacterium]